MLKHTKILSVLIAIAMIVCMLMPVSVFADSNVAAIGDVEYTTLEAAVNAAQNGDTIVLLDNITYGADHTVDIWETKEFNIDLNGHTLTTNSEVSVTASNNGYKASAICYGNGVNPHRNVSVSNGTIRTAYGAGVYASDEVTVTLSDLDVKQNYPANVQTTDEYSSAVRLTSNAEVIIESGRYEGKNAIAVSNSGGSVTVNDGTFVGDIFFSNATSSGAVKSITINGGNFTGNFVNPNKGTLTITGGTFDNDPTAYVADGYEAVDNGDGTWTVKSSYVAQIGETKYETLEAAVDAAPAGATIKLLADIDYSKVTKNRNAHDRGEELKIDLKDLTLDLNGNTISTVNASVVFTGNGATIENGSFALVHINSSGNYQAGSYGLCLDAYNKETDITLNNLDVEGGINVWGAKVTINDVTAVTTASKFYAVWVEDEGAVVTINSGTFTDTQTNGKGIIATGKGEEGGAKLYVKGGTFNTTNKVVYQAEVGSIEITGGIFDNDPTAYVADGYEAVDNGDGTWTVKSRNVAQIGDTKYTTLAAAIAAANEMENATVTLLDDYDMEANEPGYGWTTLSHSARENSLVISGNVIFDLGGHTLSNLFNNTFKITGNVTVQNGEMRVGQYTNGASCSYVMMTDEGANLVVNNLTTFGGINVNAANATINNLSFSGTTFYAVCSQGNAVVTINNGTYDKAVPGAANYLFWVEKGSVMNITGGNFIKGTAKFRNGNNPVITGGTFDFDPTNYGVADGYEAVDNNDGTWTVGKVVANAIAKVENPNTGYDATYTATKQVVDNDDAVLSTGNSVTVDVKAVTENTVASDTSLDKIDVSAILDEIVAAAGDADNIKVDIKVVSDTVGVVKNTITYEVHPEATVYVNDDTTGTTVAISNDDLEDNAEFTITLPVPNEIVALAESGMVKVTHRSEGYDDEVNFYTLKCVSGAYYVQFKVTHFSDFVIEADNNDGLFKGHSITLNGYINLNFFLHLAADQITDGSGTVVNFTWSRGNVAYQVKASDFDANTGYYKVPVRLPAAEMSYIIHATVTINGVVQAETNDYSVRDYCNEILDPTFKTNYENTYGSDKYDKLAYLVKTMLDYGAKAQVAFGRTDVSLAIAGVKYTMENVNIGMIEDAITAANGDQVADNLDDVATGLGVDYYASSLIYLSGNTIRHYFVGYYDADLANLFNGVKSGFYYYIDVNDVAAAELDTLQTFTIGTTVTFKYSALDYVKSALSLFPQDSANYNLAVATYWYNQAANAYFAQ